MSFHILGNIARGAGWILGETFGDIGRGIGHVGREIGGGFAEGLGLSPRAPEAGGNAPASPDDSGAMESMSDNNKTIALAQIQAQEFALEQASIDRQMQLAANLELGIEKLDTQLQTARLQYTQEMTGEENRHVEKLAELHALQEGRESQRSQPESGIPMPTSFLENTPATGTSCASENEVSHSHNDQWSRLLG